MTRFCALAAFAAIAIGCVEQSPDLPTEEDIKAAREHVLSAPPAAIKHPVNAQLEDKLTYLGCDYDTDTVIPAKAFTLTHYWRVDNQLPEDWKVFVHLEAPDSKKSHLNADHVPIGGKYPVSLWKKGEIIRDIQRISIPQNWPANAVEIYVGAWKGPLRLNVVSGPHDAERRVLAVRLPVSSLAPSERKRIVARKVKNGAIKVDGKLDEPAWKEAESTGPFVRTHDGGKADQATIAKVLWDDKNLYVAFDMEDKDVWSTLDKRDDKLWTQEAVEIFIDADGDGKTYIELQANPRGALFDSYLPNYRQNQNDWNSDTKVAVKVNGTLDVRTDTDKGWAAEFAIPLEAARGKEATMKNVPPKLGTEWRVNFFRMDSPAGRPQQASGWSPPMVNDFHALDRFGVLAFGDEKGRVPGARDEAAKETSKKAEATPPGARAPEPGPVRAASRSLRQVKKSE